MNFDQMFFTSNFIDELLKNLKAKMDFTEIDERNTYYTNKEEVFRDDVPKLVISSDSRDIYFHLKSCKMNLKRHPIDGELIFNMRSIGFDNSIENFRENAKILNTLADFTDVAKQIVLEDV